MIVPHIESKDPTPFAQEYSLEYAGRIQDSIHALLEDKHLYQTVSVDDADSVWAAYVASNARAQRVLGSRSLAAIARSSWRVQSDGEPSLLALLPAQRLSLDQVRVSFLPPSIRVACGRCGRQEPHNFLSAEEGAVRRGLAALANTTSESRNVQTFTLSYMCQSCKSDPVTFLLRRNDRKLTLCGRAPMEDPEIPSFIPKSVRRYWRSAVVAARCGQTLAGTSLLRICIEQHARKTTGLLAERDTFKVFDEYQRSLDEVVRDRSPSLRAVYDSLSEAVHAAIEDADRLSRDMDRAIRHFDFSAAVARIGS